MTSGDGDDSAVLARERLGAHDGQGPGALSGDVSAAPDHERFPDVLRAAIAASGRSLDSLRRRLEERGTPVSIATLSYWQSGRSRPRRGGSLRAVRHLEEILKVPSGHLSSLIPEPRASWRRGVTSAAHWPTDIPTVVHDSLRRMGFAAHQELEEITVHLTVEVDAQGSLRDHVMRCVVRATVDGARRLPVVATEYPGALAQVFTAGAGCQIGRTEAHPELGVVVAEILLDHPLAIGETAICEYTMSMPAGTLTDTWVTYNPVRRLSEVAIWVRFDPDALPTRVQATSRFEADVRTRDLALGKGTTAHHVLHRVGPGQVSVSWTW